MNKKIIYIILMTALVISSTITATAVGIAEKKVLNKELLDSSYGTGLIGKVTSYIGIGDRLYELTYIDGSKQVVFERSKSPLSKATIVEAPGTLWQTAGRSVPVNIRVRGVDLPLFTSSAHGTTTHRFELDDITDQYRWITTNQVDGISTVYYQTVTLTIPQQAAGQRTFLIKEFVKANDGRWIPGAESLSSDVTFNVIWTQSQQSQTPSATVTSPAATVTPANTYYKPPAPGVDILIDSNPQGASVQVGGAAIGRTPVLVTLFSTDGTKTLVLSKGGYQTKIASVSSTSPNPLMITLDPSSTTSTPSYTYTGVPTPLQTGVAGETLPPFQQQSDDERIGYLEVGLIVLIIVIVFLFYDQKKSKGKR